MRLIPAAIADHVRVVVEFLAESVRESGKAPHADRLCDMPWQRIVRRDLAPLTIGLVIAGG
jgi:hypothetical protein